MLDCKFCKLVLYSTIGTTGAVLPCLHKGICDLKKASQMHQPLKTQAISDWVTVSAGPVSPEKGMASLHSTRAVADTRVSSANLNYHQNVHPHLLHSPQNAEDYQDWWEGIHCSKVPIHC